MKRIITVLAASAFILTSCSVPADNSSGDNVTESSLPVGVTTKTDNEKYYAANGSELNVDMSCYSDNAKLLTADDIYLLSFNCGCVSGNPPDRIVIANKEQLDYSMERYDLALPSDDELLCYNTSISETFNEMADKYPISDYTYVLEYVEVSHGGYDLRAGALLMDEENLEFIMTADSKIPDPDTVQTCDMGGFCYMAAVPKDMLMNDHYEKWIYPDVNDMYQDPDFCYRVSCGASDTTDLYDVYGDKGYIIRSKAELNMFDMMAEGVTDSSGREHDFDPKVDFDKAVLFVEVFRCEFGPVKPDSTGMVTVEKDTVKMEYDEPEGDGTGFAYAVIPKRFLPEHISSEWQSPHLTFDLDEHIDLSRIITGEKSDTVDEGYVVSFHGGVGERTCETYVYDDGDGYRYINTVSTTISWGSPVWKKKICGSGKAKNKEEIAQIASNNGAYQYGLIAGDKNAVPIEKLMEMEW